MTAELRSRLRNARSLAALATLLAVAMCVQGPAASGSWAEQERLDALLARVERLAAAGAVAPARAAADDAVALARRGNDVAREVAALVARGVAHDSGGDSRAARGDLARARELAHRLGDPVLEARILVELGMGRWRAAQYEGARELCSRALRLPNAGDEPTLRARALQCLGRSDFKQGHYAAAENAYRQALALQQRAGDPAGQLVTYEDLWSLHLDQRRFASTLAALSQADALAADGGAVAARCRVLRGRGLLHGFQGQPEEALRLARAERQCAATLGDPELEAAVAAGADFLAARALLRLGQQTAARHHLLRVRGYRHRVGDRRGEGWVLAALGDVERDLGHGRAALASYAAALDLWRATGDQRAIAWFLVEIARAFAGLGDDARALASYREAVGLAQAIRLPYLSVPLGELARLAAERGLRDEALAAAAGAVAAAASTGNLEMVWSAQHARATALRCLGDVEGAAEAMGASLRAIESLRGGAVAADGAKTAVLEGKYAVYADAVALLTELGRDGEALEVAERARGRALLDLLARPAGRAAAAAPTSEPAPDVASPMFVAAPDLAAIRTAVRAARVTLVEYFVAADRVHVWVMRPAGDLHAASVAVPAATLAAAVAALRRPSDEMALERAAETTLARQPASAAAPGERAVAAAALRRLHGWLIAPVARWLPAAAGSPVVVVPHGALHAVPFAALADDADRPLVARHALAYAPSAGVLTATLRGPARRPPGAGVVLVGNPAAARLAGGTSLPPLPGAEREARAIGELFPSSRVTLLLGSEAREARVGELLRGSSIAHFATHALVRADAPLESLLALAPGGLGANDDGNWTAAEILASDVAADLVGLSACSTGGGRIRGEGVLGLSRAFLAAGARSVLASLWPVSDEVSRLQMEGFYRRLAAGEGKAAALRAAQLETREALRRGILRTHSGRPIPDDPVYWAPFVIVGDPR